MDTDRVARIRKFIYLQLGVFLADWPYTEADAFYKLQYDNDKLNSTYVM